MINPTQPKLNIYTKKQLANVIRNKDLSFDNAIKLIDDCLKNKDEYWFDNLDKSKPKEGKWVRSTSGTPLEELQKRINQRVFAPHDNELPPFIYGGVGGKGVKNAATALQGSKNKRTMLKIDMRRFFEHITYDDVVKTLVKNYKCGKEVAIIIAEVACVRMGKKIPNNKSKMVLARGFSTSSRLAVWCNLEIFKKIFYLVSKELKGHDPSIAIYMDDIGITATKVNPATMSLLYKDILDLVDDSNTNLEINKKKTRIIDYLKKEYDAEDESIKGPAEFEFVGIKMGRRGHLYPGAKTRSKISKKANKLNLSKGEEKSLKGLKQYTRYIMKNNGKTITKKA